MKFSSREDIEAPISYVFTRLSDVPAFERLAMRRGVQLRRVDRMSDIAVGAAWEFEFTFRGKLRKGRAQLTDFQPPERLKAEVMSNGMDGATTIELISLSPGRTRVMVGLEMQPKSIAARVLVQSLRLSKNSLTKKFKARIADFAEQIVERYRAGN